MKIAEKTLHNRCLSKIKQASLTHFSKVSYFLQKNQQEDENINGENPNLLNENSQSDIFTAQPATISEDTQTQFDQLYESMKENGEFQGQN